MKVKPTENDPRPDDGSHDESRSPSDLRTDGGNQMFAAEGTTVTKRQQARELLHESLVAPFKIAWADWRTKIGLIIISSFVFVAVLVWLHTLGFSVLNSVLNLFGSPWTLEEPAIDPATNPANHPVSPFETMEHPLGTYTDGRDVLAGLVWGTPMMLQMIMAGGVFSTIMAAVVGTTAGYKGGTVEMVLNTVMDVAMAIPGLPLVVVLIAILDPDSAYVLGVIITINVWAGLARTIHSQVLTLREQSYVEASRTMGVRTPRIIQKDILPNLMPYIMINFVYAARRVIYDAVALFYLGLLTGSTFENWGLMMSLAQERASALNVPSRWFMILLPMVPIVVLSMGLILFSQGTDRLFNPRVRTRQEGETVEEEDAGAEADAAMI